jgi:nucleoside-diphosphate-sugar epimerase
VNRVLVLGAQGFVGRSLVAALASSDWARPVVPAGGWRELDQALGDVQGVANCVVGRPLDITRAAQALFAAAHRARRPVPIVHLSSMTVYGSASGLVDESREMLADLGPYAQAQRQAEDLARAYPASVRLRPGCEYGPGCSHWSGVIARCLLQHRLGDLGAAGDGRCNLLFIDDLIAAILRCLQQPELHGSVFNLGVPDPPTWNEYFVAFAKTLGAVPVRRIGHRRLALEMKVLAPPLKVGQLVLSRVGLGNALAAPLTPSLMRACRQEIVLNVRRAEESLGMRWTPLQEGLRKAAEWCRGQGAAAEA